MLTCGGPVVCDIIWGIHTYLLDGNREDLMFENLVLNFDITMK